MRYRYINQTHLLVILSRLCRSLYVLACTREVTASETHNWTKMSQLLSKVVLVEVLQTLLLSKTNGFRLTKG